MKYKYRTINIGSVQGIKTAERLVANGWKIISNGMFTIILEKNA